jgi:hypothetical protein
MSINRTKASCILGRTYLSASYFGYAKHILELGTNRHVIRFEDIIHDSSCKVYLTISPQ